MVVLVWSLKEWDVLLVQFSYYLNLFRRVLVHFIKYYAVVCNSKGTVQSHVHHFFSSSFTISYACWNCLPFCWQNTVCRNQVNLSKTLWPCCIASASYERPLNRMSLQQCWLNIWTITDQVCITIFEQTYCFVINCRALIFVLSYFESSHFNSVSEIVHVNYITV